MASRKVNHLTGLGRASRSRERCRIRIVGRSFRQDHRVASTTFGSRFRYDATATRATVARGAGGSASKRPLDSTRFGKAHSHVHRGGQDDVLATGGC